MLSVGVIRFEDRFCASKKGGIGGGGQVSAWDTVHMAAALAGCRKAWGAVHMAAALAGYRKSLGQHWLEHF